MTQPFVYPAEPHVRRHGPRGYADASGFKPWLRDEFVFRCVFCLDRETWQKSTLDVEHFEPASLVPQRRLDYGNLLYACRTCNGAKSDTTVPDPCQHLLRGTVSMDENGTLTATTPESERIIDSLALNAARHREYRRMWRRVIEVVQVSDPGLYQVLMGYPTVLPDLERLRPPGGNARPDGVAESCRLRRLRGELPETI